MRSESSQFESGAPQPAVGLEERLFSSKWSVPVLLELQSGPQRLSTLCRRLPSASKKIIIETLSGLLRSDLIERIEYEGKVKHVEYQLTLKKGRSFGRVLDAFSAWKAELRDTLEKDF